MTTDNEETQIWRKIESEKQERHLLWKNKNLLILKTSGLIFEDKNETLLFREKGKPKVDFYPSTGRWKVINQGNKMMHGGAQAFLNWYKKESA